MASTKGHPPTGSSSSSGSSGKNSSNNNCVICLESLLAPPAQDDEDCFPESSSAAATDKAKNDFCDVGVATPCGHPCHVSCFEQWSAFQNLGKHLSHSRSNKEMDVKPVPCPTCQQTTESFVKVFLRAEQPSHTEQQQQQQQQSAFQDSSSSSDDDSYTEDEASEDEHDSNHGRVSDNGNAKISASIRSIPTGTFSVSHSTSVLVRNVIPIDTMKRRRKKRDRFGTSKTAVHHRNRPSKHKLYKQRWQSACHQIKTLKMESQNRKDSHHSDLMELERINWTNYKLMKEMERIVTITSFRRNAFGLLCFGAGWYCKKKAS